MRSRLAALFIPLSLARVAEAGGPVACRIDVVWGVHVSGGYAGVTGWAVDQRPGAIPPRVTVAVGDAPPVEIERGRPRPDVAGHFGRPDLLLSSFHGAVRIPPTATGEVSVEVVATSADGVPARCGLRTIRIRPFEPQPVPHPVRNGGRMLLRAWLTVFALSLAGAALLPRGAQLPRYLFAPAVGLAILGLSSEVGRFAGMTPFRSFSVATAVLVAVSVARARSRPEPLRFRAPVAACLLLALGYSAVAVLPMARQGDGVVMGGITDALLECSHADSFLHPERPTDEPGYRAAIARSLDLHHHRPGQSYLLAAMAGAEGVSPERVHSSAMLAGGITLLLTASAMALAFLPRLFALPTAALLALNSVLFTALYAQHLANLLGLPLLLLFVSNVVALLGRPGTRAAGGASIALAAGWTFYPEFMPGWIVFLGVAFLLLVPSRRRLKVLRALVFVVAGAAALNPAGLVRAVQWTAAAPPVLLGRVDLRGFGDSHYYPPLSVFVGASPYRLDAEAPLSRPRRLTASAAFAAAAAVALAGFAASGRRRRRLALALVLPPAAALAANVWIGFPYGFSRGITGGVVLGTLTLLLLAVPLAGSRQERRSRIVRPAFAATGLLLAVLSAHSVRHVIRLNAGLVPIFDPAYRELPRLAAGLPEGSVVAVDGWSGPDQEWVRYMLGSVRTTPPGPAPTDGRTPAFRLIDLRTTELAGPAAVLTPCFAAVGPPRDRTDETPSADRIP